MKKGIPMHTKEETNVHVESRPEGMTKVEGWVKENVLKKKVRSK